MCPGFLRSEEQYITKHPKEADLGAVRLGEWIDERIFSFAAEAGWLPAITFYAVREPRYQRASVHWSESVKQWRKEKPAEYPSLERWLTQTARCDDTAHLVPEIRKARECFKVVEPECLADAVSSYIDWEAFGYWARSALEHKPLVVDEVARELHARCPGFAEFNAIERSEDEQRSPWNRLIGWIGGHFFKQAKAAGWYEAIIISARSHPRAIRTMEYADHCDEVWKGNLPVPYPSFESWRRDADRYVELEAP